MSEWKEYKWGDLATLEYGKGLRDYQRDDGKYPVYGTNGKIGTSNVVLCPFPSVIIGRKGAYRGVHFSDTPFYVIDTAFYLNPKFDNLDIKFAYYQLLTININYMDSGSAIPSTSREDFYDLDIMLPPLTEQHSIASILSSLDDKIDLLHRQNKTLEALAETLFRQWFVEETEESCEVQKLGDYGEFKNGINYSRDEAGNTTYGIINVRDVVGNKFIFKEAVDEINIDFRKAESYLLQKFDIVIVRSASPGETALILENQKKLIYSGFTIRFRPHKEREAFFFFQLMQSIKKQLDIFSDGTTLKNLNQEILKNIEFQVPSFESIRTFNKTVEPMFDKISKNSNQIRTLARLRDTLLPKLMSGEVRIKYLGL